jgi:DNA-binding NarL/FixJ family response regulator
MAGRNLSWLEAVTAGQRPIQVLVVDDHPVVVDGLTTVLQLSSALHLVATASSGREALSVLAAHSIDVVLVDLRLPDISGFDVLLEMALRWPSAKAIVLSNHEGDGAIRRALHAGARGYIAKGSSGQEIIGAIQAVASGHRFLSPSAAAALASTETDEALTGRERQVIDLAARGLSNKQIALHLRSTERNVKYNLNCIFQKLGVADRTHAVRVALRRGLIDD